MATKPKTKPRNKRQQDENEHIEERQFHNAGRVPPLMQSLIQDAAAGATREEDRSIDLDSLPQTGPEVLDYRAANRDEQVIDELLINYKPSSGYYMVVHKEISPNVFQYKMRIDTYEHWVDMEVELANLVKAQTEKNPRAWGTGKYQVQFKHRNGQRNAKGYRPIFFEIDAGTDPNIMAGQQGPIDQINFLNNSLEGASGLITALKSLAPEDKTSTVLLPLILETMRSNTAKESSSGNSLAQVLSTMMSAMQAQTQQMMTVLVQAMNGNKPVDIQHEPSDVVMARQVGLLKDLGIIKPEKDSFTLVREMKEMGLLPQASPNDPVSQLNGLRQMIGIVKEMGGLSDAPTAPEPSVMDKIVEGVAQNLPALANAWSQAEQAKAQATIIAAQASAQQRTQPQVVHVPVTAQPPANVNPQVGGPEVNPLFAPLYEAIRTEDKNFFPTLMQQLTMAAPEVANGIRSGQTSSAGLVALLHQYGGKAFSIPAYQGPIQSYAAAFVAWARQGSPPSPTHMNGNGHPAQPKSNNPNEPDLSSFNPYGPSMSEALHNDAAFGLPDPSDSIPDEREKVFVVECSMCHDKFEFANESVWNAEQDKSCGNETANGPCSGILQPRGYVSI